MPYTTLIKAETLLRHLSKPGWRTFDCRASASDPQVGIRAYRAGHIPGARHADLDHVLAAPPGPATGRHPLPDRGMLTAWFSREGVGPDTQIVAYDDACGMFAARLWWLVRWLGHASVAVLDGGLEAWRAAGGALVPGTATAPQAAKFTARPSLTEFVTAAEVLRIVAAETPGVLVDARAAPRYRGESEPLDPVAGHIPGARNRPFAGNLDADRRFLPVPKLRERFGELAADHAERVVHYCGSGVTACHNLLAMEHAGLSGSKLYAGSWSEWIRDRRRPVARDTQE